MFITFNRTGKSGSGSAIVRSLFYNMPLSFNTHEIRCRWYDKNPAVVFKEAKDWFFLDAKRYKSVGEHTPAFKCSDSEEASKQGRIPSSLPRRGSFLPSGVRQIGAFAPNWRRFISRFPDVCSEDTFNQPPPPPRRRGNARSDA